MICDAHIHVGRYYRMTDAEAFDRSDFYYEPKARRTACATASTSSRRRAGTGRTTPSANGRGGASSTRRKSRARRGRPSTIRASARSSTASGAAGRRGVGDPSRSLNACAALERRGLAGRVLMPDDGEEYSL